MTFEQLFLILHVLGAGLIIGVAILALASVIKPPLSEKSLERLAFVGRFGMWASIWQLATGIVLYMREPKEFNENVLFWIKIALYVLEGVISSMVVNRQVKRIRSQLSQNQTPSSSKLTSALTAAALAVILIASIGVVLATSHGE